MTLSLTDALLIVIAGNLITINLGVWYLVGARRGELRARASGILDLTDDRHTRGIS